MFKQKDLADFKKMIDDRYRSGRCRRICEASSCLLI